jgi:hypothetical protein
MYEYWIVIENKTGRIISHCGNEIDAQMMCNLYPNERTYRKQKFIADQVIDVVCETDKQLPGQLGLPASIDKLEMQQQVWLPEGNGFPVEIK